MKWHRTKSPGVAVCGNYGPNEGLTETPENVTCRECSPSPSPEGKLLSVRLERQDGVMVLEGADAERWDEIVKSQGVLMWSRGQPTPHIPWRVEERMGQPKDVQAVIDAARAVVAGRVPAVSAEMAGFDWKHSRISDGLTDRLDAALRALTGGAKSCEHSPGHSGQCIRCGHTDEPTVEMTAATFERFMSEPRTGQASAPFCDQCPGVGGHKFSCPSLRTPVSLPARKREDGALEIALPEATANVLPADEERAREWMSGMGYDAYLYSDTECRLYESQFRKLTELLAAVRAETEVKQMADAKDGGEK